MNGHSDEVLELINKVEIEPEQEELKEQRRMDEEDRGMR